MTAGSSVAASTARSARSWPTPVAVHWALARHPNGMLVVADAVKGLLSLDAQGRVIPLTTEANGVPFGFTDDVAVDKSGHYAYFSDASSRWGYGHDGEAIIEHGADGRLLRYDFQTGKTSVLLDKLQFANGVTLGPDEAYVLVNETGAYRISRYWLSGPKAGTHDVFIDNLPGLPDNLSFNGTNRFWVALYAPRNALLDGTAEHPFVRKMIVPGFDGFTQACRKAWVCAGTGSGRQGDCQSAGRERRQLFADYHGARVWAVVVFRLVEGHAYGANGVGCGA